MATDAKTRLEAHARRLGSIKSDYYGHVFQGVAGAYSDAFNAFNKKLDEQKTADDLKMELAMTVLIVAAVAAAPIAAGSAVTALAGTAVGRTMATYSARVASSGVATSKAVQWAVSQGGALHSATTQLSNRTVVKAIWAPVRSEVASYVRKQSAKQATRMTTDVPGLEIETGNPSSLLRAMTAYVKDSYAYLETQIEAAIASDGHKDILEAFADDLDKHPFLKRPPTIDEATLATMRRRFELALFLDYLMQFDRLEVTTFSHHTRKDAIPVYTTTSSAIPALPGSPDYPRNVSKQYSQEGQRVVHRDPGNKVEDRINELMAAELDASNTLVQLKDLPRTLIRDRSIFETGPFGPDVDAKAMRDSAKVLRALNDASPLVKLIPAQMAAG
ncbi:hypothetical protein [Tateyamaria sp. ANG-S1]|uniref:hypothetical protein n=1 Tax=Tateyamaria sp. ANG-S1 TaxID=1577905 RepID=UPI00057FB22E|nr:hypothetical protein [Tateyamaria sp. ANG-S1]KIC47863.1 hypothetical protein RA29_18705 [Tateyamaria sp. ANG-S1]